MIDYKAWFDGACEPFNPGGTATSGTIVEDKEGTVLLEEGRLVGIGEGMSNNVADLLYRHSSLPVAVTYFLRLDFALTG
jgi:hypothetical protein